MILAEMREYWKKSTGKKCVMPWGRESKPQSADLLTDLPSPTPPPGGAVAPSTLHVLPAWLAGVHRQCWRRRVALYCSSRKLSSAAAHIYLNGCRAETTSHLRGPSSQNLVRRWDLPCSVGDRSTFWGWGGGQTVDPAGRGGKEITLSGLWSEVTRSLSGVPCVGRS